MRKLVKTIVLLLVVVLGLWVLFNRERIKSPADVLNVAREKISSFEIPAFQASSKLKRRTTKLVQREPNTIRIASFKLNPDSGAAQQADANPLMTEICRQFDLVSFQAVNSQNPEWLANLVLSLGSTSGSEYKFVTSPFVDGTQSVTLYNSRMVELEESNCYTVNDPDDLFRHKPFVCWFRANNVEHQQAFTFSLASIYIDPSKSTQELVQLGNLYRAIREDGRGEDDIIFVGDFHVDAASLGDALGQSGLQSVLSSLPTNLLRTAQFDNILSSPIATVEFSGAAGVCDFMKQYNLYLKDALRISHHLPVWADYSIYEGVVPGRVAHLEDSESSDRK